MKTSAYGVEAGQRGYHPHAGEAELEVAHTNFMDNNRARYRYYGGDKDGEEFTATAEHFNEKPKNSRCPTCGEPVYSIFDHLDGCPET